MGFVMTSIQPYKLTTAHRLLLRALLADADEAIRAWKEWQETCQLSTIDETGYALLPQLYRRLSRLQVPESSLVKLKGIYRHTWCQNHLMMVRMADAFARLKQRGIECLLLNEAALLTTDEFGTLPVRKCAFLIPPDRFSRATAFFRSEGWSQWSDYETRESRLTHYINFTHHDGTTCSIYRSLFAGWETSWGDEDCWRKANTYRFQNIAVRTLCPADQLLILLLDIGLGYRPISPRTIADIATLLHPSEREINWGHFRTKIAKLYVTLPIKGAVGELSRLSLLTLPVGLSSAIDSLDTTWAEYQQHNTSSESATRDRIARSIAHHWCRYERVEGKGGSITGFIKYLQDCWQVQALWLLPLVAMKKLGRQTQETQ
jgi:hypothetical protein